MFQESLITRKRQLSARSKVQPATNADIESVTEVVMMTFSADPVARWVCSDPGDYIRYFPELILTLAGNDPIGNSAPMFPMIRNPR
jgi:hypothetical protein